MAYTYILYSEKIDKYYVGACINLDRRLREHNRGKSKFTRLGIPWIIAYSTYFDSLIEAKKEEMRIKRRKSRRYIERLIAST